MGKITLPNEFELSLLKVDFIDADYSSNKNCVIGKAFKRIYGKHLNASEMVDSTNIHVVDEEHSFVKKYYHPPYTKRDFIKDIESEDEVVRVIPFSIEDKFPKFMYNFFDGLDKEIERSGVK